MNVSRALAGLLILGCLYCTYLAVRWGYADMVAHSGYDEMALWNAANPVNEESWQRAYSDIARAHALDPSHPVYLQRLARLHRIRITEGLVTRDQFEAEAEQAVAYLEESIRIRPRWAFTWAELALMHWMRQEGDQCWYAMERAVEFGPWEPPVIDLLTFLGLQQLQSLEPERRQVVIDNLVRGLRSPASKVFDDTFARVRARADLKVELVTGLEPHLVSRWRPSVRYNFFRLSDWGWELLGEQARQQVVAQAMTVMRQMRVPYAWIRNASNDEFRAALCEAALGESPGDENLKVWCAVEG